MASHSDTRDTDCVSGERTWAGLGRRRSPRDTPGARGGSARQSASKLTYELPAYAPIQNLIEQTALIKVNW